MGHMTTLILRPKYRLQESNSLILVLTKSTGVLDMSTISVHIGSVYMKFYIQISTDPDEFCQPEWVIIQAYIPY